MPTNLELVSDSIKFSQHKWIVLLADTPALVSQDLEKLLALPSSRLAGIVALRPSAAAEMQKLGVPVGWTKLEATDHYDQSQRFLTDLTNESTSTQTSYLMKMSKMFGVLILGSGEHFLVTQSDWLVNGAQSQQPLIWLNNNWTEPEKRAALQMGILCASAPNLRDAITGLTAQLDAAKGTNLQQKPLRILSIDGGGIRGVIPALIIARIEHELAAKTRGAITAVSQVFDIIAGTSTGGILALGLSMPTAVGENRPKNSAKALADLYLNEGMTIFPKEPSRVHKEAAKVCGVLEALPVSAGKKWAPVLRSAAMLPYSDTGFKKVLQTYFSYRDGTLATLRDAITEVVVPTYDIGKRSVEIFTKQRATVFPEDNLSMVDLARSTSSAPTYFAPYTIEKSGTLTGRYTLVDGGVIANNPTICAYAEARRVFSDREIQVVSLGCGFNFSAIDAAEASSWVSANWLEPLLGTMFDGMGAIVDANLSKLIPRSTSGRNYFRLQPRLGGVPDSIDDASNVKKLADLTEGYLRTDFAGLIDDLMEMLLS
jgi:hypothetical protein